MFSDAEPDFPVPLILALIDEAGSGGGGVAVEGASPEAEAGAAPDLVVSSFAPEVAPVARVGVLGRGSEPVVACSTAVVEDALVFGGV